MAFVVQAMTRSACLEQLAAAITAVRRSHPTRVGIDGVDAAGKTTLADELVAPLSATGRQVIRASVDDFLHPSAIRYTRGADSPEGYFRNSFNCAELKSALLDPLGPGGSRRFRTAVFDYRSDQPVERPVQTAVENAILLVDGVFLQRFELVDSWDYRVWVDAPFDVTVPRAVRRAAGEDESVLRMKYGNRYVPGQLLYMNQCRPRESADVIVDNADFHNPDTKWNRS